MVLYQVCSNYGSVVKWHRPGGHRYYEAVIVLLTLPLGAVGLYTFCECGVSWSYIISYIDLHIVKT